MSGQDQHPGAQSLVMDAAGVNDSALPQVSNLLRKLAQSPQHQQQQQHQMPGSKVGLSPLSLRERLLSGEVGGPHSSLTAAESRSSSDLSGPFDSELQSLWDLTAGGHQPQQMLQYEGSPLNPNLGSENAGLRQQLHLRQQLGIMAAALLPRSQPTESGGSGDNRAAPKRRWGDCLGESNSLPSSAPTSPPRGAPADNLASFLLEAPKGEEGPRGDASKQSGAKEPDAFKDGTTEWEPRVRRKKGKGNTSDEEGAASDDGIVRIKAKSMTERQRRDRISDALRRLRGSVNSHGDMATMLNEAVDLIQQQKRRIEELEMQILQQRLRQQLAGGCRTLF